MENSASSVVDRFSDLPECIIHHIISLLSINDSVCLGRLSQRFRQLCRTCPQLNFFSLLFDDDDAATAKLAQYRFYQYLDDLLRERLQQRGGGQATIHGFRLHWRCRASHIDHPTSDGECIVVRWINMALECGAKELDLKLILDHGSPNEKKPFLFPTSSSLKVLQLHMNNGALSPPNSGFVGLVSLEDLLIERARFTPPCNSSLGEWISNSCKRLKCLRLGHFHGVTNLNIVHSCIERLQISCDECGVGGLESIVVLSQSLLDIEINWWFSLFEGKTMRISAPNLQRLSWAGNSLKYCFDSFTVVDRVLVTTFDPPCSGVNYNLENLILSISSTNSLVMDILLIEMIFERGLVYEFGNLRQLDIRLGGLEKHDLLLPAIASILMRSPHLETLAIGYYQDYEYDTLLCFSAMRFINKERWGPRRHQNNNMMDIQLDKLKEVKMEYKGGANEFELIKYLLQHAKGLEKVTIYYSTEHLSSMSSFHDKLKQVLSTITSSPTILYLDR